MTAPEEVADPLPDPAGQTTGSPSARPTPPAQPAQPASGLARLRRLGTFQTIREVPSYRWYLVTMAGNMSAMQMQMIARGILTYQLTGSYAALGVIELANTLPRLVFALTGGVVADRSNRRTITQIGQTFNALIAGALAVLLFMGLLTFTHLVIGSILAGISNSFSLPARQAMIPQIVGIPRLSNALGLNASMMSVLRLSAPAVAATVIAFAGASWAFLLMALLYLLSTIALFRVHMLPDDEAGMTRRPVRPPRGSALADIAEAMRYIMRAPVLRMLLVVDMFLGMLMFPYQRLLPGFVSDVLAETEDEAAIAVGLLLTFTGVGALIGALAVASIPGRHRGKLVIGSVVLFSVGLLAFSASDVLLVSCGIVLVMGVGQTGRQALNNILIQSSVTNEYRGRVSSVMLFEDGIESLGIFAIAMLATVVGAPIALAVTALLMLMLAGAMWFAMPSYRRLD